jgi:hypothetical protein
VLFTYNGRDDETDETPVHPERVVEVESFLMEFNNTETNNSSSTIRDKVERGIKGSRHIRPQYYREQAA